jgi:hypothetical protein
MTKAETEASQIMYNLNHIVESSKFEPRNKKSSLKVPNLN